MTNQASSTPPNVQPEMFGFFLSRDLCGERGLVSAGAAQIQRAHEQARDELRRADTKATTLLSLVGAALAGVVALTTRQVSRQEEGDASHALVGRGLSPCSGAIIGIGETDEDIAGVAFALRELDPDSVPVNFLIPFRPLRPSPASNPSRARRPSPRWPP
jgi:hypothetical protein